MKKAMILFMALTTFAITAQGQQDKKQDRTRWHQNLSPEQRAQLQAKKLTLQLDLDQTQQAQVNQLLLKSKKNRPEAPKNRKEMTDAQKFEARIARLDSQIAFKNEMKQILDEKQYQKWEKAKAQRKPHFKDQGRKGRQARG